MGFSSWLEQHITLHNYDDAKAEFWNAITHAFGALLAVLALISVLVRLDSIGQRSLRFGLIIWALSMILLYSASSLYHALKAGNAKRVCRILDHSNIYILIAGTYTPLMLYVNSPRAQLLLVIIWLFALAGIVFSIAFWGKLKLLHVLLYLLMGWMIVFFWNDIVPYFPSGLLAWVIAAGVTYSVGTLFYSWKKLPYYHAIWHLFCIAASTLFYVGYMTVLI